MERSEASATDRGFIPVVQVLNLNHSRALDDGSCRPPPWHGEEGASRRIDGPDATSATGPYGEVKATPPDTRNSTRRRTGLASYAHERRRRAIIFIRICRTRVTRWSPT